MTCFPPFKVSPDETLHLAIAHHLAQAEIASAPPRALITAWRRARCSGHIPPEAGLLLKIRHQSPCHTPAVQLRLSLPFLTCQLCESGFHFSPVFTGNYNRCINHSPMKAAFLVPSFLRISGKTIHVSYRPVQNWRPPTYRSCLFTQTFSLPFVQGVENEDLFSE